MRRLLMLLLGVFVFCAQLLAQNRTITGTVTDNNGQPLANVSVTVKGANYGTTTDANGSFTLSVGPNIRTLVISSIGFGTREVAVTDRSTVSVALSGAEQSLNEVVVVAYGKQSRRSLTGSATSVNTEAIARAPRTSIQESFQGNVAGVQAVNGSGQPGSVPNIRIRGVGSISAGSAPLYVVDGVPIQYSGDLTGYNTNVIAGLNSADIESITVLKDAASASLYGSRAANGVVLITTKSGRAGKTKISGSAQYGINNLTLRDKDLPLTTTEMIELLREGWVNAGRTFDAFKTELTNRAIDSTINTDWVDALTRQGYFQQYDLSASGGNDRTTFYISGGLNKTEAALKAVDYTRLTSKMSVTNKASDRLNLNGSLGFSYQQSNTVSDAGAFANPVRSFYRLQPWLRIYNPDGSYDYSYNSTFNPVALAEKNFRRGKTYSALGTIGGQYNIYKGLNFETKAGLDMNLAQTNLFWSPGFGDGRNYGGYGSSGSSLYASWITTNLLKYGTTFGEDHTFDVLAGYEAQKARVTSNSGAASNFAPNTNTLANASKPEDATSSETSNSIASWISSLSYNFKKRYYLTGSFRRDGSSRFGAEKRYGNFWSVGASWNVVDENFMQGLNFLSDLKLRASYGVNGNQDIGNFASRALYGVNGYENNPGYVFSQFGNANLTWEENKPFNVGVDFGVLRNRLTGTVEYYDRTTSSLLLDIPISSTNGVTTYSENVGEMKNKGWEFSLSSKNIVPQSADGFSWDTDFNLTTQENKITKLVNPIRGTFNREVGLDFYQYYLVGYAGVDPQTGEALWYTDSARTKTTKTYSSNLRFNQGSALPSLFGGLTNRLNFKGFMLSFQFYYNFGNKIYDSWGTFTSSDGASGFSATGKISRYVYENRWRKPGDVTDVPKVTYLGSQTGLSNQTSSRFLYDGDYIRLRDVTLAYNLSKSVADRLKVSNARFYVRANNLYTWVKDDRLTYDPEVPVSGDLDQRPPIYKTMVVGLDISF